jgi:hypothetical protein
LKEKETKVLQVVEETRYEWKIEDRLCYSKPKKEGFHFSRILTCVWGNCPVLPLHSPCHISPFVWNEM